MKKLLAALLAAMMMACGAFAEEEALTAEDFAITMPENVIIEIPEIADKAMSGEDSDIVTVDGSVYTITAGGLKAIVEENAYIGMLFTQDFRASFDNYDMFDDISTAKSIQQALINNGIHFLYLFNSGAEAQYQIIGSNRASMKIGDLAKLDDSIFDIYAEQILTNLGGDGLPYTTVATDDMKWLELNMNSYALYISVAGSQYVSITLYPDGDALTEDEFLDMYDILYGVKIIAAE